MVGYNMISSIEGVLFFSFNKSMVIVNVVIVFRFSVYYIFLNVI